MVDAELQGDLAFLAGFEVEGPLEQAFGVGLQVFGIGGEVFDHDLFVAGDGQLIVERDALGGFFVVLHDEEKLVGDAAAAVGEAGVFGEAFDEGALEGDALVGAEGEVKFLAGLHGAELAGGDEGAVEENVQRAGEEGEVGGVGDVRGEEGGGEALRDREVFGGGRELGGGDGDFLRGVVAGDGRGRGDAEGGAGGGSFDGGLGDFGGPLGGRGGLHGERYLVERVGRRGDGA